ncbi:D-alanine--D-alanine ligase family protein [Microbacterium nymphoidis]|uniref:D-alanine--D-alanine ligase family protein n=1 Tax=Microbacterium nymphoidis TaxID=2898586 RepID=UPI001E466C39|nr:D-alanine--D-alanine ligase [Microbacterium nymphoidis]MCD2497587.1 D-alanine--D-alanine ligase [Microbacterium nymphoidis]
MKIAVIGGGRNDEHLVSLASAAGIAHAARQVGWETVALTIDEDGTWRDRQGAELSPSRAVGQLTQCDVVFPALHGVHGEDGAVAGLLELCGVPFVGSPVRAGAIGMDKWLTKLVATAVGIRTAEGVVVPPGTSSPVVRLPLPVVVKPATGGSSNGVSVVGQRAELSTAIADARRAGATVLVEEYVRGREVDVAVFRDATGQLRLGSTLEIGVEAGGVFGRAAKYDGTARFTLPADLSASEHHAIRESAAAMYDAMECSGVARFDFFVTDTGLVLNEVNTSPGMTEQSQVPRMFAAVGMAYPQLIAELVAAARVPEPIGITA